MKKFNLKNEIIVVQYTDLLNAIKSKKIFGISIDGNIYYEPYPNDKIYIFQGKLESIQTLSKLSYKVVEDNERILLKAQSAWNDIIKCNTLNADYDDTTADGIGDFSDNKLEDIGWYATEFNISYRELVEILEDKCEGTLLCVEIQEPYQFSGLGFLDNRENAYEVLFEYCKIKIKDKIENDSDFEAENLTDDEQEAAEFFGVL